MRAALLARTSRVVRYLKSGFTYSCTTITHITHTSDLRYNLRTLQPQQQHLHSPTCAHTRFTVDISSKSNTTPTRTARSSYPPCGQKAPGGSKQPRRLDCMPTPPPSGHNTPIVGTGSRPKSKQDRWLVADLDARHDTHHKNSPRVKDSNYSRGKKDRAWQTSTLV